MRQLAFLESSGNKKAKAFFRSHGILGPVDYTSQLAERWRNELAEAVLEMYPKKNQTEFGHTHSIAKAPVPEIIQRVEENKIEKETKIEEQKEPEKIVAVQPIVSRSTFKVQATEVKHKFKKSTCAILATTSTAAPITSPSTTPTVIITTPINFVCPGEGFYADPSIFPFTVLFNPTILSNSFF